MWALAVSEKAARRFSEGFGGTILPPQDERMMAMWPKLSDIEKDKIVRIVEGWVIYREEVESELPRAVRQGR